VAAAESVATSTARASTAISCRIADPGDDGNLQETIRTDEGGDVNPSMQDKRLVIVGGGSGIGRQLAADAVEAGATVVLAGRNQQNLEIAAATLGSMVQTVQVDQNLEIEAATLGSTVQTVQVDIGDEESIRQLAEQVGQLDYLVVLAANHANGPVSNLERDAVARAFDAKVIGPIMLAKHLGPRFRDGGSMLIFSGVAAWRPAPGLSVMATANGAVSFLASALAVELGPIRVNALSPGIVDSGAWDDLGEGKDKLFEETAARNPARRVGQPADISSAAMLALTNPFLTGTTLHVDGGGSIV
jgi:NAD(P)-dependent dehydrogenase (short-subunit alcohol dehydrogenase family)